MVCESLGGNRHRRDTIPQQQEVQREALAGRMANNSPRGRLSAMSPREYRFRYRGMVIRARNSNTDETSDRKALSCVSPQGDRRPTCGTLHGVGIDTLLEPGRNYFTTLIIGDVAMNDSRPEGRVAIACHYLVNAKMCKATAVLDAQERMYILPREIWEKAEKRLADSDTVIGV
ncbi:hypothetical protein LCGC14_0342830 [marine sediment metagenome]|uniref:Uncharacterized protein n=1 Tax=marine sediment metagenome TaxID=412755 RepID=A0A0F9TCT5_9ZZZZ